jgi:hypothetical protein
MRLGVLITVLLGLAGCDSPGPGFSGGMAREVVVDGSRFRVFVPPGGSVVQAHRVSFEMLPSLSATFEKAYRAIEQATGCKVLDGSLRGDQAIILAEVDCVVPAAQVAANPA